MFFCRVQNIFLIIVIIICLTLDDDNLPTAYPYQQLNELKQTLAYNIEHFHIIRQQINQFIYIIRSQIIASLSIPLILDFIVIIIREYYYYKRQGQYDFKINEENECLKLIRLKNANFKGKNNLDILEKTKWGNLQIGDIVLLKKDEYCPADILIFDMWDSKCTVKTSFIDDQTEDTFKYSPLLTTIQKGSSIKGNFLEYRRILSGRIDIKKTYDISNFRGFISLKKDPISEKFGHLNLIQKYSQIKFTDWLIGIVVLCGNDSYSYKRFSFQQKEKQRRKPSYFQRKWDIQSIIQILMICFLSLIVIILRISMSCFKSLQFKGQMIPIAIDLIFTFPSYCSVINSLGFSLYTIFSNYLFKQTCNGIQNQYFGLNYLNSFAEMSLSSHVLFNSLKIQNSKQKNISTICLKDRFFRMTDNIDGQSNNHIKSINTLFKIQTNFNQAKSEIGDDQSLINSPISNLNQKSNLFKIIQNGNQSISQSNANDGSVKNGTNKKSVTNWNQISSTIVDGSQGFNRNQNQISIQNGSGQQMKTGQLQDVNQKKNQSQVNQLSRIIELDSKSFLGQFENESLIERDGIQKEPGAKTHKNSHSVLENFSSRPESFQQIYKKESLSQFQEINNMNQTFAENMDLENSIHSKIGNHITRNNISITKLNLEKEVSNVASQEEQATYTNFGVTPTVRKVDDTDVSYINNLSHRGFIQDQDVTNKNINHTSQDNSPIGPQLLTKGQSIPNQNIDAKSNILNTIDSDQQTFMKGSFASANFHQQIYQNFGRSNSQQADAYSTGKVSQTRILSEQQKNYMIMSFGNHTFNDKEAFQRQEKKSPSKSHYFNSSQNGSVQNIASSPKWRPASGVVSNKNSGQNGSDQSQKKIVKKDEILADMFQENTEQSQQINIELSQSSTSVQIEGKNREIKLSQQSDEDKYVKNMHINQQNYFKTNQTGQAMRKSLIDDYFEFDLKSSDEDDSILDKSAQEDSDHHEQTLEKPSNNNLICNILNSHSSDEMNSKEQNFTYITIPNKQHPKKENQNLIKKNNLTINGEQQVKNQNTHGNELENLNLISSEMEVSQSNNQKEQNEQIFYHQSQYQNNIIQTPTLFSEVDENDNDQNNNDNQVQNAQKFSRFKKIKSFTNKDSFMNNKKISENLFINQLNQTQESENNQNNILYSSENNQMTNGIYQNPQITKLKQNINTIEELNSGESLQKRLSVSTMLPSTNNIIRPSDLSIRMGSNIIQPKKILPIFENLQGFNKAILEKNQPTKDLLFAMAICHQTKTKGDRLKNGTKVQNVHLEEDTSFILDFTKKHHVEFECACTIQDQNYYILKTDEGYQKIQILQKFTFLCNQKMIIQAYYKDESVMIIRESSNTIPIYLQNTVSAEKKQKIELLLSKLKKQGEKIIFYSKIILTEQQQYEFQSLIRLETSKQKIEQICNLFILSKVDDENSPIQFLGFIGLQEESDMHMKDMIKELKYYGQKIWILTSNSQSDTLQSCYNYKILSDRGMDIIDFTANNFDELFYKTRNHLQVLKKVFTKPEKNEKENLQVSQSFVDPAQKDANSSQVIPTLTKYENSTPQYFERKSTFGEQNMSFRKNLPQMNSQISQISQGQISVNASKKAIQQNGNSRNIIQMDVENSAQNINNTEKVNLNYYVILSGESLNVIRNNTYLWDHFCLIAFFANGIVGYEMTDEQKSILGQTITTRFHRSSQRVVNIISSINDFERLNFEQVSVYIGSPSDPLKEDKTNIISQHADVYMNDSMSFLNVFIRESRLQSEIIDDTMYLAIHRSYLTALVIIFWNIWTCSCNYPLFIPYQQVFFHGLQYLATFIYYARRKREKFNNDKDNEHSNSRFLYSYFSNLKLQYSNQYIPILNIKIIISSIFDIALIFLFYTNVYNFNEGMDFDIEFLQTLMNWGVYFVSFCRVFDLQFIKFDRYLIFYIFSYLIIILIEISVIHAKDASLILITHSFINGYILNTFLFICFYICKTIIEGIVFNIAPISIIGLGKYIIQSKQQAKENEKKQVNQNAIQLKSTLPQNDNKDIVNKNINNPKQDIDNKSENNNQIKDEYLPSPNQQKKQQQQQLLSNNNMTIQKSEMTSINSITNAFFSSHLLKGVRNKINPIRIIRSIFKDKEMDIILSSIMQEDINLSQTQMQKFTLQFQIKEIEVIFLKAWELLIPYSNRIFYVFNFIVFDIGYDIIVLSKVTNEFSSADGSYVMSYAITASTIFILTSLSLSKYYSKKNIMIISLIVNYNYILIFNTYFNLFQQQLVIVRSIKLILLSSFKEITIYPTECIMHISVACSCLRFSHYNLLLQGILLFGFFIIMQLCFKILFIFQFILILNKRTETTIKEWNLEKFLVSIGYIFDEDGGVSDSIYIIRICFYISYFIILALFISEKYNVISQFSKTLLFKSYKILILKMILTIRKNYLSEHNLYKATMKVKDILSKLLPKFIREKIETMKYGQYRVAERQEEVVIAFCDICNFDDIIFNEKINTVKILDKLYRQFDLACQQNGLQKIETVGKTYLAAAGISDVERLLKAEGRFSDISPAKRALTFAFDLQRIVKSKSLYLSSNKKIIIKVGIHLGPAISGVIGYHKPQFSLIGDTVNTTSRVCSTGLSDIITISNEVYHKVYQQSSQYKFQQRDVEAKGKGIMITYQVFDKKSHRGKTTKKQTLNFLDDTALTKTNTQLSMISNNSTNQPFSGLQNLLTSFNTNLFSNRNSSTQNQIDMTDRNEKQNSDQNIGNNLVKKNSNKLIPLQAIPESPLTSQNQLHILDFKLITNKGDDSTQSKQFQTANLIPISDKSISENRLSQQNIRMKQTSFGAATDLISPKKKLSFGNNNITQRKPRNLKKSSSFTIVDVKPRFKNDSIQSMNRAGSINQEDIVTSPLIPSKNEYIKNIEKKLLMHIEVEPEQINLKDFNFSIDKIKMHIQQQDLGGEKSLHNSHEGNNSHASHLKLGICSAGGVPEQKQLRLEFLKSSLKQQVQSVRIWLFIFSIYFLVKSIIIINFINNKYDNFQLKENIQLKLSVFSGLMFLIFFPSAVTFKKLNNQLSLKAMRIFLYILYFLVLIICSFSDISLDNYLDSVKKYNLPLIHKSLGHTDDDYSDIMLESVTKITLPSTIIYILEIEFIFMFFTSFKFLNFLEKTCAYLVKLIAWFIYSSVKGDIDSTIFFFLFIVGIVHLRIQYHHMQNEVRNFNNLKTLEVKKEELDSLLKNLLPSHILDQFLNSMKKEIPLICEELDNVTLLFADIAGFTKYSSTTDPIVVVNMLRKLFTDFDDHCLNQNVYKLYTIGDCYVCFGLNNKNDRHPAQEAHNVVRFAFDMIRIVENVRQYSNCSLQMRIGIHTGKLYGGIVGTEIVRYDVYGQDVIIANKMESNGETGYVMVSETTKKLLEDNYPNEFMFEFKESVHIKQINKDIDGFLIRFNENASVYLENPEQGHIAE